MYRVTLRLVAVASMLSPQAVTAQVENGGPKAATYITAEDVKAVNALAGFDRQIVSVDVGNMNVQVGVIHRLPPAPASSGGQAAGAAGAAASTAPPPQPCGEQSATRPADGVPGGIMHDSQTETYIIMAGAATSITGGRLVNARRMPPDSDVTRLLNGPSCTGTMTGADIVRRAVKAGDVVIIPAGVPHALVDIVGQIDYLVVRSDPDRVVSAGYVNPAVQKK